MSIEKPRTLEQIAKAMMAIPTTYADEGTHMDADDLLIEALKRIAALGSLSSQRETLERLIEHYQKMPKWYA